MIRTPEGDLEQELRDPEYVKLYGASDAKAEIAITLAEARHAAKKTQKEVADAMSLSQPYVARLEGGEANPTIGTIGSLLAVMGFRLVARTAPLKPEPSLSSSGLIFMSAADMVNTVDSLSICRSLEKSRREPDPYYSFPVNAGTATCPRLDELARYSAREVVVGGAAK
jgi:transcriptional regulator with XRE-family HTH domain